MPVKCRAHDGYQHVKDHDLREKGRPKEIEQWQPVFHLNPDGVLPVKIRRAFEVHRAKVSQNQFVLVEKILSEERP